jgi:D-threo-aldose 1-dehydrogenase
MGKTGVEVTQLGLGGVPFGDLYSKVDDDQVHAAIRIAYESGVNYFDTSPWYGSGQSEHRMGRFLRCQRADSYVLSTKVGRVLRRPSDPLGFPHDFWAGGLPFEHRFDYTYDGVMRSYEDSLQRLGMPRVDLLLIHDLDFIFHKTEEAVRGYLQQLSSGGWRALEALRDAGEIHGIGAGINEIGMIPRFLDLFPIDFFLVAMRYTLLDQDILGEELPRCVKAGVGIVIGSPYSSGILATGPTEDSHYGYKKADEEIKIRVRELERLCGEFGVPLKSAALQFPLGHPSVASVIPGASSVDKVEENIRMMMADIPEGLWNALKSEGLLRTDAPTPAPRNPYKSLIS